MYLTTCRKYNMYFVLFINIYYIETCYIIVICSKKYVLKSIGFNWVRAHAYNPSYLGDWHWEDHGSRPVWANSLGNPHLQNNESKMVWRCDSRSRVSALQVWSPKFRYQYHQKQTEQVDDWFSFEICFDRCIHMCTTL
jgi:hypothetical protein